MKRSTGPARSGASKEFVFRAVLDANLFISALIQPEGNPGRILKRLLEAQAFSLVVSEAILQELRHSLEYPRVRKRLAFSEEELDEKVALLQSAAIFVEGEVRNRVVTADPDDEDDRSRSLDFARDDTRGGYLGETIVTMAWAPEASRLVSTEMRAASILWREIRYCFTFSARLRASFSAAEPDLPSA